MYTSLQGKKKKKALRDVRLRNTLFPEVQRRDMDKAVILAATAKVNLVKDLSKKSCRLAFAGSQHGEEKVPSCPEIQASKVHSANKCFLSTSSV